MGNLAMGNLTQCNVFVLWEETRAPVENPTRHGKNMQVNKESVKQILYCVILTAGNQTF